MNVRMPDGTIIQNVPEGTTQDELMRRLEAYQAQKQNRQPDASMRGYNPPERNLMSSVVHGGLDIAEGAAQLASRGAEALGLPPGSDYPFIASPDVVQQNVAQARAKVDEKLGRPQPQGFDIARMGAGAALAAPFAGGVGTAETMLGRAAQAARAGGVQGGMQPVPDAKSPLDFAKSKAFQVAVGSIVGGGGQPALEMGANSIASIANSVTNRARGAIADASETNAALVAGMILGKQGIALNSLDDKVRNSIVADVQEALKKYGGVNAAALGRQADFKALGVENPLKPWVTRDPVEFGRYKNLEAGDAGDVLKTARADLDRKLAGNIEKHRGLNAGDAYQAGSRAEGALARQHASEKANIDALYDRFRRLAPNQSADGKRMAEELFKELDDSMAGGYLPDQLRNHLNDMVMGKTPATPTVLYQLQKIASTEARKGGNEGFAAGKVVGAIDRELDRFSDEMSIVGPEMAEAVGALKQARSAYRSLKMKEEAVPALKAVAEGSFAAEDFFKRYILGADVKEVAAMWAQTRDEVKQAARSQLIDYLKSAGQSGADTPFKADTFSKALNSPGMPQKIEIMLGKKGLEDVRRVQRGAEAAISIPSGTRYNTSGTAAEIMNLLNRTSGFPVLGPMVTEPLKKLGAQVEVSGMQKAAPLGEAALDPYLAEILRRMRQGSGLLSSAAGGGAAGLLSGPSY